MTATELGEVVEQRMGDPTVLGRLASNLGDGPVAQRHHDGRSFTATWQEVGDQWRCSIVDAQTGKPLAQVDIHENHTVRADAFEPCRITVSPLEALLCVTRYKPKP